MAEHQVMSWSPKHHSHKRDFVSHHNARVERARRLNTTFDSIKPTEKEVPRAPVQPRHIGVRRQRNLAPSLLGALRPLPKTTRNLNGQTIAQLASEHDNLPAMVTFMCDEIG